MPLHPLYDVTSPRPRSSPRPALMSPPVIHPVPATGRRQKLLPAIPLEVDTETTPRSRRSVVVNGCDRDNVRIVISERVSPPPVGSPSLREKRSSASLRRESTKPGPTPPRPARRRRDSNISPRQVDLVPPRPDYSRSASPCDSTTSSVSDAPTPRATPRAYLVDDTRSVSKRDSTQRRLDALRGLVANLDFNQPWSLTDEVVASGEILTSWNNADGLETLDSPAVTHTYTPPSPKSLYRSPSQSSLRISKPLPLSDRFVSQDHGWQAKSPPRPRSSRSDLPSNTPTRMRKEIFNVASSGYSRSLEPASPTAPPTPETTWRSCLSIDSTYHHVLETRGLDEVKRQEVIAT